MRDGGPNIVKKDPGEFSVLRTAACTATEIDRREEMKSDFRLRVCNFDISFSLTMVSPGFDMKPQNSSSFPFVSHRRQKHFLPAHPRLFLALF